MTEIVARTARLTLRTEAEGDQAVWRAHMNDERVMARLGGPRTPAAIAEAFAQRAENWARHGFTFLMLERSEDGLLIGQCGLSLIESPHAPPQMRGAMQIGWLLRADCWGQGYALEAARAMRDMAFARHGAAVLYAQTSRNNPASWRLIGKLGMTRRADLDYVDPDHAAENNPAMVHEQTRAGWRAQTEGKAP